MALIRVSITRGITKITNEGEGVPVVIASKWGELEDEAKAWRERRCMAMGCVRRATELPNDCRARFEMKFEFQMNSNLPRIWIKQMKALTNPKDDKQNMNA
jgi:hypothetical protein